MGSGAQGDNGTERGELLIETEVTGFDLRDIEEVVELANDFPAGVPDGAKMRLLFSAERDVAICHEVSQGKDSRDGLAKIVRGHAEKGILEAIELLEFTILSGELPLESDEFIVETAEFVEEAGFLIFKAALLLGNLLEGGTKSCGLLIIHGAESFHKANGGGASAGPDDQESTVGAGRIESDGNDAAVEIYIEIPAKTDAILVEAREEIACFFDAERIDQADESRSLGSEPKIVMNDGKDATGGVAGKCNARRLR